VRRSASRRATDRTVGSADDLRERIAEVK